MYDTRTFTVSITGIGTVTVQAVSNWQAVELAHTAHMSQQPDRKRYKARQKK
jgi:hypothetical protein